MQNLASHPHGGVPQAVIHVAGVMDFNPRDDAAVQYMHKANVDGVRHLLTGLRIVAQAANVPLPPIIHISSTEILGACTNCTEDTVPAPDAFVYEYGRSKAAGEAVVQEQRAHRDGGFPYIILRPTGIMGPGDFFSMFETMAAVWSGAFPVAPAGAAAAHIMYTHRTDVVQGILRAVKAAWCEQNRRHWAELIAARGHAPVPVCATFAASPATSVLNQTYFVAADSAPSLKSWMTLIATAAGRLPPLDGVELPLGVLRAAMVVLEPVVAVLRPSNFFFRKTLIDR